MLRLLASVVSTFVGFALLGYGIILWRAQDPAIVEQAAANGTSDPALLELLRGEAAAAASQWWLLVMAAVAVCGALWLLLALNRKPQTPGQARSGGTAWWGLLVLAVLAAFGLSYVVYINDVIALSWRQGLVVTGLLFVPLVYWLTTALGVRNEMAPSVPFATALRR
jgi:hypothetical protein